MDKTMSDVINGLVSEKVMKWHRLTLPNNDEGNPYYANFWVDVNGKTQKPVNFWNPNGDEKDALYVLETLKAQNILINIETYPDEYKTYYNGTYATSSVSLANAISIAAIKSVGIEVADCYSQSV